MKDEQYIEITHKINNLKTLIEKKHAYPEVLHQSYRKILEVPDSIIQDIPDKSFYLSKNSSTLDRLKNLPWSTSYDRQKASILEESRIRVQQFSNDLEQLDNCIKKKNKLRALRVREEENSKA